MTDNRRKAPDAAIRSGRAMRDLFDHGSATEPSAAPLGAGAVLLRGFCLGAERQVLAALQRVVDAAPFRHMVTPGGYASHCSRT